MKLSIKFLMSFTGFWNDNGHMSRIKVHNNNGITTVILLTSAHYIPF